jgi:hypothetical protein
VDADEERAEHLRSGREQARERRAAAYGARRRRRRRRAGAAAVALLLLAAGAALAARIARPALHVDGPAHGALLGHAALERLAFRERVSRAALAKQRWTLDGRRVEPRLAAGAAVLRPRGLADGTHVLSVTATAGFLRWSARRTFTFTVDTTPPTVRLRRPAVAPAATALVAAGTTAGAVELRAGGRHVPLHRGRFEVRLAPPLPASLVLVARDRAGNVVRYRMPITEVPRRPAAPVRAVHVTAYGWADPTLREGVLALIREHRIDAVEIDLKDESGVVGWPAPVPLARRIDAVQQIFDLGAVVRRLHGMGVRVIGRVVCFRDPMLAAAAWRAHERDQVIQTPGGAPYAGYGGFTNFASETVRRYNVDIAVAAAKLGVDDILYDYVRRPDGPIGSMRFPGLHGPPEQAIVGFLADTRHALAPRTFLGASVFGVAATRPSEVAQDIPAMAREVDYIAPMVYPSHWAPGEYDVADPNAQPYEIVRRSLADFARDVRGTGARIVPWLQDFSLGVAYGPEQVRAQIRAARDEGMPEFVLWDPAVTYTAGALDRDAPAGALGTAPAQQPEHAPGLVRLRAAGRL